MTTTTAILHRANLDGSGLETIATGIRNTVGFDWNPRNHELYFTDNGRDWMSEDLPNDELNRITKLGEDFGEPYCHQGNIPDPTFGWGHDCKRIRAAGRIHGPARRCARHEVLHGKMFPPGTAIRSFVARHGSWNKTVKFGGDIRDGAAQQGRQR
jgi:glucose/arabinose dehydrogenase